MTEDDLDIAPLDIRRFLAEAQHLLQCNRVKTHYGEELSTHWFYVALQANGDILPTIVTVEVRRVNGTPRVFLTEVRKPTSDELTEIGAQEEPSESEFPTNEATEAVRNILGDAKTKPRPSTEQPRRRILAHDGSIIDSAYMLGPWRISPAMESASGPFVSEKIICCDRLVIGADAFDVSLRAGHLLKQLSVLLSVFWIKHFYETRSEHRWTINPGNDEEGQLKLRNELRQLGYAPEPLAEAPASTESGPTRAIDRLDVWTWATKGAEPFRPPEDAHTLYELFERAEIQVAQRFLEAAKAYHTAEVIWPSTTTGAIAYLVVAAESLMEEELPQCTECHQHRGVSKAFRDEFFKELPCLMENEAQTTRLLKDAYNIRSRHFHDAEFLAGEMEEWRPTEILMPDSMAYRATRERLLGLVNGLLVAYLIRKVTGSVWDRALRGFPDWREDKLFSMSMTTGETPEGQTGEKIPSG